jgi:TonB family protein
MPKAPAVIALAVSIFVAASPLLANTPGGDVGQQANEAREKANGEFILKHYPQGALDAGEQGLVRFRITLDQKGEMTGCEVTKSSGYSRLDTETCELIQRYARFQPPVNSEGRAVVATRNGYVNWRLPAGILPAARPRPDSLARAETEKLVCRRGVRTGSLVATNRRCMRDSDWNRMTGEAKRRLRDVQGSTGASWGGVSPGP